MSVQKAIDYGHYQSIFRCLLHIRIIGYTIFQLGQGNFDLTVASFCDGIAFVTVECEITGDFSEICSQIIRFLRRNAVPCAQICIIYAFLRV